MFNKYSISTGVLSSICSTLVDVLYIFTHHTPQDERTNILSTVSRVEACEQAYGTALTLVRPVFYLTLFASNGHPLQCIIFSSLYQIVVEVPQRDVALLNMTPKPIHIKQYSSSTRFSELGCMKNRRL